MGQPASALGFLAIKQGHFPLQDQKIGEKSYTATLADHTFIFSVCLLVIITTNRWQEFPQKLPRWLFF